MSTMMNRLHTLQPGDLITLWILDITPLGGGLIFFYNPKDAGAGNIVFQGNTYVPYPIKSDGYEVSTKGASPRPVVTIANVNSFVTDLILTYGDLVGSKVTRKRTLFEFLDGQPGHDATQELTPEPFIVERKRSENNLVCEFELAAPHDVEKITLPRRKLIANSCAWIYRGTECGFAGNAAANSDESIFMGATFTNGVTHGTNIFDSATANFTSADLGRMIVSDALPTGTGIAIILSTTSVQLTKAALNSLTGRTFQIVKRVTDRGAYNAATTYAKNDQAYTTTAIGIRMYWYSLVNSNTDPLTNPASWALDLCGKRVFSCKARFGPANLLRTSAFPGIDKLASL